MNYSEFYKNSKCRLTDGLVSLWASGHPKEQECLRELLDEKEPLIAEPVFQTIFPWESAKKTFEEHATSLHILDKEFVQALSDIKGDGEEFRFPSDRYPYKHQSESWKGMLVDKKTVVVTSGTGSGKTECFIIPVLQDLYRERCKSDYREGVQAIFLYPLNALMKNQRERIHQWSKALPKPVSYAIYNSDMEQSGKTTGEFPQVCTRKEMREHPPQILFTNPTMLNYMMVRSSDQPLLEKSKGRLRWILLDEAHTYSGSAATELALQIRRVIDAFGVTIDDVNFAVTSATIGDKNATDKLIGVVSQLTGKVHSKILVINGQRIVPELNSTKLQQQVDELNRNHGCRLTSDSIKTLREKLNERTALSAAEIAKNVGLNAADRDVCLSLINDLSTEIPGMSAKGESLALLPTRAHFFVRAINGIYTCVNPECPNKSAKSLELGTFTTYQSAKCPHCGSNMLEVACCSDCGELLIVGENHVKDGYRLRTNEISLDDDPFEMDSEELEDDVKDGNSVCKDGWTMFVYGRPRERNPKKVEPLYFEFDTKESKIKPLPNKANSHSLVFQTIRDKNSGCDLCPCCGVPIGNKLRYLRASANLLGRFLASTILDNATPMNSNKDKDVLYDGRKYITFTDSRQGAAKFAMSLNQDVERNWIRSAVYQKLAIIRQEKSMPQGLTPTEESEYEYYKMNLNSLPQLFVKKFEELKKKKFGDLSPEAEPESLLKIKKMLDSSADLKHLFKHLNNARQNNGGEEAYLEALFLDQFGWIPRNGNSLENLGLVHVVYPPLDNEKLPGALGAYKLKNGLPPFTNEDWHNYLKICVDYQIRGNKHYKVPKGTKSFLIQNLYTKDIYDLNSSIESNSKWPQIKLSSKNEILPRQSKLVLLLMAALGVGDVSKIGNKEITLINTLLQEAWGTIRDKLLSENDPTNQGYLIDLFDENRVKIQIVENGWRCPVDNVVVDTLFRGYSPRMRGYATVENFERFKINEGPMEYPYFPYAEGKKVDNNGRKTPITNDEICKWIDDNWISQKQVGVVGNLHYRVMSPSSIFLAAEHSAQQQSAVLESYEKEFNQGRLNVLSCSTTMEMGVDLKGISAVVMNSVPPKPANYQQRAGRAGRRGETKALALTFCPPNPIGINAWENPMWPLNHKTEIPDVKLTSSRIVQRHINAFLFELYIREAGGINVKERIYDFFTEKCGCEGFRNFLQGLSSTPAKFNAVNKRYGRLVSNSCLSKQSLLESIETCLKSLESVYTTFGDRLSALNASLEAADDNAAKNAIKKKKEVFGKTFLLGYLAEQNFLPSAGIPTGLVEFNNVCKENSKGKNVKMPTLHLCRAISMYAPGKQIVVNEWGYQSGGIAMKSKFDDTKRYVVQNCQKCGYSLIVYGSPLDKCPKCQSTSMVGMKKMNSGANGNFTEVIEPAGFSVDWLGARTPSRIIRNDSTMMLTQPLLLRMDPWPANETDSCVALRASTEESEILFYNSGIYQAGFMLCPYCGRMESEPDDGNSKKKLIDQFIKHKHLESGAVCEGAGHNGARIRHNVLLVGRYQTDFVEIKFYNENSQEIVDTTTLYSLGVIICRKLTEFLGVNDGEIDFGYNGQYHSIFIYDTALGGAGYSTLFGEYKNKVFDLARNALKDKCCSKACTHCLVDKSSQWYINYLDRQKAYDWLEMEYNKRN